MKRVKYLALTALLLPLAALAGEPGKAMIITSGEKPSECLSAIEVNKIDGKEAKVQKLGFSIEPGVHSISGRTIVNTSFCKAMGNGMTRNAIEPVEANFEAGKTYYLGYDHSSPHRKDWKLVIWKVEDQS